MQQYDGLNVAFFHLNLSWFQVAVLAELQLSNRASDELLMMYYPFLGFGVVALLRGLCSDSGRSATLRKRTVLPRKKRAWNEAAVCHVIGVVYSLNFDELLSDFICSWLIYELDRSHLVSNFVTEFCINKNDCPHHFQRFRDRTLLVIWCVLRCKTCCRYLAGVMCTTCKHSTYLY